MSHADNLKQYAAIRDRVISAAVRDKKITADSADAYRRMYDANAQGVTQLLTAPVERGGLMAGVASPAPSPVDAYPAEWVPELGRPAAPSPVAAGPAPVGSEYPSHWLPELAARATGPRVIESDDPSVQLP